MFVEIYNSIHGISREAKVIHDPKQYVTVCYVKCRCEVYYECIYVLLDELGIFILGHNHVFDECSLIALGSLLVRYLSLNCTQKSYSASD